MIVGVVKHTSVPMIHVQTCSIDETTNTSLIRAVHNQSDNLCFIGSRLEIAARKIGLDDLSNGAGCGQSKRDDDV